MLRLPTNPLGPFWLEDLGYFVMDEVRRLPNRTRAARSWIEAHATRETVATLCAALRRTIRSRRAPATSLAQVLAFAPLDEPETWSLATDAVSTADLTTARAVTLHNAAAEQLDALTYALDRIRDEVRPLMTYARFADEPVHALPTPDDLDSSIAALLELSRQNSATRPKRYAHSAA